jgi:hypothetical protein
VGLACAVSACAIADTDGPHPIPSASDESVAAESSRPRSVNRGNEKDITFGVYPRAAMAERLRLKSPRVNRGDAGNSYLRCVSGGAMKNGFAG